MSNMLLAGVGTFLNTAAMGGWKPKQSAIQVGRDVGALTATGFSGNVPRTVVIGDADDVRLKSNTLFGLAKANATQGHRVGNFRQFADADLDDPAVRFPHDRSTLFDNDTWAVQYNKNGTLEIYEKDAEKGLSLVTSVKVKEDLRITWGENGEPRILSGGGARTNGVLKADGPDEILIRTSGADVKAGKSTVVFNLSASSGGNFSGGNEVTYLGAYDKCVFSDTSGLVTFAGYFNQSRFSGLTGISEFSGVFDRSEITQDDGVATFSGYFSASSVSGSDRDTLLSGMFLNGCIVQGGAGADLFSGRFIDAEVDGGDGDDTFGSSAGVSRMARLTHTYGEGVGGSRVYLGLEADFINSAIAAGDGNDTFNGHMFGSELNLESGNNTAKGIFLDSTVNGGDGDETISAMYSSNTIFNIGLGLNSVELITCVGSQVISQGGENTVTLGLEEGKGTGLVWQDGVGVFGQLDDGGTREGHLDRNTVDVEQGRSRVTVHTRERVQKFSSNVADETSEGGPESADTEVPGNGTGILTRPPGQEIAMDELMTDALENGNRQRKQREAQRLYGEMLLGGDTPSGPVIAATIYTATGVELAEGVEQEKIVREKPGLNHYERRWTGKGRYQWTRDSRVEG